VIGSTPVFVEYPGTVSLFLRLIFGMQAFYKAFTLGGATVSTNGKAAFVKMTAVSVTNAVETPLAKLLRK
jgi:hypothetical protein